MGSMSVLIVCLLAITYAKGGPRADGEITPYEDYTKTYETERSESEGYLFKCLPACVLLAPLPSTQACSSGVIKQN